MKKAHESLRFVGLCFSDWCWSATPIAANLRLRGFQKPPRLWCGHEEHFPEGRSRLHLAGGRIARDEFHPHSMA